MYHYVIVFIVVILMVLVGFQFGRARDISYIDLPNTYITETKTIRPGMSYEELRTYINNENLLNKAYYLLYKVGEYPSTINMALKLNPDIVPYFWYTVFYMPSPDGEKLKVPDYLYFNNKMNVCIGFINDLMTDYRSVGYKRGIEYPVIGVAVKDRFSKDVVVSLLHELFHVYFSRHVNHLVYYTDIKIKTKIYLYLYDYLNPMSTGDLSYNMEKYGFLQKQKRFRNAMDLKLPSLGDDASDYSYALEEIIIAWASTYWGAAARPLENPPKELITMFRFTYNVLAGVDLRGAPKEHQKLINTAKNQAYFLAYLNHRGSDANQLFN